MAAKWYPNSTSSLIAPPCGSFFVDVVLQYFPYRHGDRPPWRYWFLCVRYSTVTYEPEKTPPGWLVDPWDHSRHRWWGGSMWTAHTRENGASRLHPALSWPIIVGIPLALLNILVAVLMQPISVLLVAVSGGIVLAVFLWLDRVEPEPMVHKLHAILWGATVAVSIALVGNETVGYYFGEVAKALFAAPFFEEIGKGLGIWWMVRKGRVRTTFDGVVYAGLVAGGFAAVENFVYFAMAGDYLVGTFIGRGIITPFAHPLFTIPIGVGLAMAVQRGRGVRIYDFWGLPLAMLLHSGWNLMTMQVGPAFIVLVLFYISIFVLVVIVLCLLRRNATRLYPRWIGTLAFTYRLTPVECETFHTWRSIQARRRILVRSDRKSFDALHSAIIRLMEYNAHGRHGSDHGLVQDLYEARRVGSHLGHLT